MITQQYILFLTLSVLALVVTNTKAFTQSKPALVGPTVSLPFVRSFTYLCAEETQTAEDDGEASNKSDDGPPSGGGAADDILNSPEFLKRKIDVLKSDLEEADAEIAALKTAVEEGKAEWGEQLDKLQTEFGTIQERLGNQNKKGDTMATVQVVREMLGVLDNYDRALGAIKPETDEEKEIEAEYKATYEQILKTFESLGVTVVETVGKEFDYEFHQAVMQMPTDEYEEGIVCSEMAKGFALGDTLIRAAMVAVAC